MTWKADLIAISVRTEYSGFKVTVDLETDREPTPESVLNAVAQGGIPLISNQKGFLINTPQAGEQWQWEDHNWSLISVDQIQRVELVRVYAASESE